MRKINLIELIIGIAGLAAAVASLWMVAGAAGFLGLGLALLMAAIAVVDFRHFVIPNELTAAALALAAVNAVIKASPSIADSILDAALRASATMLFFFALRLAYRWLRKREGIGLGDVKLAFVAGAWLDWTMIPVAIEIAALVALFAYFVWQALANRPLRSTSRLPFGLFFAPAIWLSWLIGALLFGSS